MSINVHRNIIHNSSKVKLFKSPSTGTQIKYRYSHDEVYIGFKKRGTDTYHNMDEPPKQYAK